MTEENNKLGSTSLISMSVPQFIKKGDAQLDTHAVRGRAKVLEGGLDTEIQNVLFRDGTST